MYNNFDRVIKNVYFAAECSLLLLAFFVAHWLRGLGFAATKHDSILFFVALLSWMMAAAWTRFRRVYFGHSERLFACLKTILLFSLFLTLLAFVFKEAGYSRLIVGYFIALFAIFVAVLHFFGDLYVYTLHRNHKLLRNVLALGHPDSLAPLCEQIQNHPEHGYAEPVIRPLDILKDHEMLATLIREHSVNELILVVPFGSAVDFQNVFDEMENFGVRVSIIPDMSLSVPLPLQVGRIFDYPVFLLEQFPLDNSVNKLWKRLFDIFFSAGVLLVFSPVFLFTALYVKVTSPGSVFFRQKRTGYNQKEFGVYKFRSMRFDKEMADALQATEADPRITPVGRFMRRTNIDELPQFWNVLKGDMSVVGPRPHMLSHTEEFSDRVGGYLRRHHVRPGITGWAQVNGWRGLTDTDEKISKRVEFDLWYVENWTLWLDIKIVFLTLFGTKTQENAF